jgi:rfaE bifunctional protein kinase chain/domain
MKFNNVDQVFDAFNQQTVLIIGDVMLDSYAWGKVERISPEAPVPIVSLLKSDERPGGAANVALNVLALGAKPLVCTVVGNDSDGKILKTLFQNSGLSTDGFVESNQRRTTSKKRVLASDQHLLRIDSEDTHPLLEDEEALLLKRIEAAIEKATVVVFEDYDKGSITENIIQKTVEMAQKKGIPTTVDPKKRNFSAYKGVTLFKPNLKELKEGLKVEIDKVGKEQLHSAVKLLDEQLGAQTYLITLSEYGVFFESSSGFNILPAFQRAIADVSGAGDTVISTAALALAVEMPIAFVASISNLAGGLVCEQVGVVPIDKDRLKEEVEREQLFEMYAELPQHPYPIGY